MAFQVSQVLHHRIHHFEVPLLFWELELMMYYCNLSLSEAHLLLTTRHH